LGYGGLVKTFFYLSGRVSTHDCVRGHVTADHSLGTNDSPVANDDPGEDGGAIAYPDIIANDNVSFGSGMSLDGCCFWPGICEGGEWVSGDPVAAVIATQDDGYLIRNRTEPAYDQLCGLVKLQDGWFTVGVVANIKVRTGNTVTSQDLFLLPGENHDFISGVGLAGPYRQTGWPGNF